MGVMSLHEGLKLAKQEQMDLVEIVPTANPPVCKIMKYDQYRYMQQKKAKEAKKKQKVIETKEIKVRPNIADHDFQVKVKQMMQFFEAGNKVVVSLQFKGREASHNELGFAVMQKFQDAIGEAAKVEVHPKMEGRRIFMILAPK